MNKKKERELQSMRKFREEHFEAHIVPLHKISRLYPDEVRLEVTYNGEQWYPLALNRKEMTALSELLKTYLSEN